MARLVKRNDTFVNVINLRFGNKMLCENIISSRTALYWDCIGIWKKKGSPKTKLTELNNFK
jgi:hypothetical protein